MPVAAPAFVLPSGLGKVLDMYLPLSKFESIQRVTECLLTLRCKPIYYKTLALS